MRVGRLPGLFAALALFIATPAQAETRELLGDWRVETLNGTPILPGSEITLRFTGEGRVAGKASCNRYGSTFSVEGDQIAFTQAMSTRMACPPTIMRQEQQFLAIFAGAARWSIADGALNLAAADGSRLRARRR